MLKFPKWNWKKNNGNLNKIYSLRQANKRLFHFGEICMKKKIFHLLLLLFFDKSFLSTKCEQKKQRYIHRTSDCVCIDWLSRFQNNNNNKPTEPNWLKGVHIWLVARLSAATRSSNSNNNNNKSTSFYSAVKSTIWWMLVDWYTKCESMLSYAWSILIIITFCFRAQHFWFSNQ